MYNNDEVKKEIGKRIKELRERLGMSQEDLARAIGYKSPNSRSTIYKVESGKSDISQSKLTKYARALQTTVPYILGIENKTQNSTKKPQLIAPSKSVTYKRISHIDPLAPVEFSQKKDKQLVPVLGKVVAGIPIEAIEEIIDYELIPEKLASQGEYFALKVTGDSMYPRFIENDVVIVRQQDDVDSGSIAIMLIGDNEATIKRVQKFDGGINLVPNNREYDIMTFTNKQVQELPVRCIGKVVELRARF